MNKTHTNALIHEKSPYLLQHAHNPVDWLPWGKEAFQLAREQNKPVLVSIGYATCHWCHVMERESFEDPQLAKQINADFICIKVDREERPDVDSIYMQALHAMGQQGGWPLNVFVTPEGLPFYGGTYFPPVPRYNRPSFSTVLTFLSNTWKNDQDKIARQSQELTTHLRQNAIKESTGATLSFAGEEQAVQLYEKHYDTLHHGFRFQEQNKFPPSMGLSLLLRHHHRTGHSPSLKMAENTLRAMKNGGIYDQIDGGLSRYSTDHRWLVPHFEKMLYDNALFVTALIETHQVTGNLEYADYANDVLSYIDRDMTSPEGAFYSAEDADSEGVEGKFYVWSKEEIESVLGRKTSSVAIPHYNVSQQGNFEHKNILHVTDSQQNLAQKLGLHESLVREELAKARTLLLETRGRRTRPLLDDKVLTSWNGLMVSAMAKVGRVLGDQNRIRRAEKVVDFILSKLRTADGTLLRRYRDGDARYDAYLFDYSSLAIACLDLYEATYDSKYIRLADDLMQTVEKKFKGNGVYYETASDGEDLIVRQISGYDGVEPSGNSSAALALLRLSAYLADPALEQKAENIFQAFHEELMEYGLNSSYMLQAVHLYLGGLKQVAVIGNRNNAGPMLEAIRKGFFPNAVFAFAYEDEIDRIPLLSGRQTLNGKTTAYVCKQGVCLAPVHTPEQLIELLDYA